MEHACVICKSKTNNPHWHMWNGKRWALCQKCSEQRYGVSRMCNALKKSVAK